MSSTEKEDRYPGVGLSLGPDEAQPIGHADSIRLGLLPLASTHHKGTGREDDDGAHGDEASAQSP